MYCKNCGNETDKDLKFCSSCGADLAKLIVIENTQETDKLAVVMPDKKMGIFNSIIAALFLTAVVSIPGFLDFDGLVAFLFIGIWILGEWFPEWYMRRGKANTTLVKWIVWSNILTWLLPPLGILTGFAALNFGDYFPSENKKYKTIAVIALVASLLNVVYAITLIRETG